jgi:hypothetical protein
MDGRPVCIDLMPQLSRLSRKDWPARLFRYRLRESSPSRSDSEIDPIESIFSVLSDRFGHRQAQGLLAKSAQIPLSESRL